MVSTIVERLPKRDASSQKDCLVKASVNAFHAGVTSIGPTPHAIVRMHLGPSVEVRCIRRAVVLQGREAPGNLNIVPAHTPLAWSTDQAGAALVMCVPDALLRMVAMQLDRDPACIEIADRFQIRDPVIEHIGWSIKADIDGGRVGGDPFRHSIGVALAARLLERHYRGALPMKPIGGGLRQEVLQRVLAYIEDRLANRVLLVDIADVAGMSISHLKALFRKSMALPVHEYVVRRRLERAQLLLRDENLSIADVALAAGFAHQSHLARHMQRIIGASPTSIRNNLVRSSVTFCSPVLVRGGGGIRAAPLRSSA